MVKVGAGYYETEESEPRCRDPNGRIPVLIGETEDNVSMKAYGYMSPDEMIRDHEGKNLEPLLSHVKEFIREARVCEDLENFCPIPQFYVIPLGPDPTHDTWAAASELTRDIMNADLEVYLGCSDVNIMQDAGNKLNTLETEGRYRIGIFTLDSGMSLSDMIKYTDPANVGEGGTPLYVRNSRVYIHENQTMQAKFAGKVASTRVGKSVSEIPYKSVKPGDIPIRSMAELDVLSSAGIISDWVPYWNEPLKAGIVPYWAVSTAYRLYNGQRPVDSKLYVRLTADYVAKDIMQIFMGQIYRISTEQAIKYVEKAAEARLQFHKSQNLIRDFKLQAYESPEDPEVLNVDMALKVSPETRFVNINSQLQLP